MLDHKQLQPASQCVHGGWRKSPDGNSVSVPIHQSVAFQFDNTQHAVDLFEFRAKGNIYSRLSNPTNAAFENRVTLLEGGESAVAFASGQAAVHATIANIVTPGDNVVASPHLYGGVWSLLAHYFADWGVEIRFVSPDDPSMFEKNTDSRTRAYIGETIPNPRLSVFPIQELAAIGRRHHVPLIVDNTAAPLLCRPFEHGAAVVLYSATKFLSGHSNALGGIVIDSGTFDWEAAKNPRLTQPDSHQKDQIWSELARSIGIGPFGARLRACMLREIGATMAPMNAFLMLQGIETLHLRMQAHSHNALQVATMLEQHPAVSRVNYPGRQTPVMNQRADTYLKHGKSGLLGFELKEGKPAGERFINALKLLYHVANIGDCRSLAVHPASTTHSQLTEKEQADAGLSPGYVRLSIGIEDSRDIIQDIKQALEAL